MFDKVADSLLKGVQPEPEKRRFHPPPTPQVVPGSATDMIFRYMRRSPPGRWFFFGEVAIALGRTKGEVDWGLRRLRVLGWVEAVEFSPPKRPPVLRYRLRNHPALELEGKTES